MPGPPPPPPMPGSRGPPAPPPPPLSSSRPPAKGAGRGALLSSIESGTRLKKVTQVNDRSAPMVSKSTNGPAAPMAGAPPVPGIPSRPAASSLAPPSAGQRGRSSSDGGQEGGSLATAAPQLGGLFAGGMPKLRKTTGAVNTGADKPSYLSDPEVGRHAPRPVSAAPPPPRIPGAVPPRPPGSAPSVPQIRPYSVANPGSLPLNKPKPPPLGRKPPVPPPSSRKLSGSIVSASASNSQPLSPPPPPPSAGRPAPAIPNGNGAQSLAQQAALNAFSRSHSSTAPPPPLPSKGDDDDYDPYNHMKSPTRLPPAPSAPPPRPMSAAPPPPPINSAMSTPIMPLASPSAPPPPPPSQSAPRPMSSQTTPPRSMLDINPSRPVSTQSNGNRSSSMTMSTTRTNSSYISESPRAPIRVQDSRWRFTDDNQLSKPREFVGIPKRYRAGRVSTVPLDLDSLR